jgi:predicted transcriptional regulator of viral defense system
MKRDPRETERALMEFVRGQGGYFTAAQALSVGYTYRQQNYHKNRGNWTYIDHGLYRLRNYPESEHEDLIRWSFWSRNRQGEFQATVSHDTALAIHELGDVMPGKTHLTVPPGFRKKATGGCIFHTAHLDPHDIEHRQGFNATTPFRTLLDVADSPLSQDLFESVVRDALRRGMVRSKQLLSAELPKEAKDRLKAAVEAAERVEVG